MRVVLFGSTGQIGHALHENLYKFCEVITDHDLKKKTQSPIKNSC